jgi:hypothetical protein
VLTSFHLRGFLLGLLGSPLVRFDCLPCRIIGPIIFGDEGRERASAWLVIWAEMEREEL